MFCLVQTPLNIKPNTVIRRLIAKLEIPCPDCQKSVARGDLAAHKEHSCSKREVAEAKGTSKQKETKTFQFPFPQTQENKYPNSIFCTKKVGNNICSALCELETLTKGRACGALCEAESGGQRLLLFIGTDTELNVISSEELCDEKLELSFLEPKISISLPPGSVRLLWQARLINATVVELSAEATDACRSRGLNFLKADTASRWQEEDDFVCCKPAIMVY